MKKFLFCLVAFVALCGSALATTTRYIAQTAGTFTGGTACNGQTAITVATFNGITSSAGDTNYICGTLTASAGTTGFLTLNGNGSSGNPITLKWDTGAVITAPYWGFEGVVNSSGNSYWTLDGGTNGVITASANGTGLANSVYNTGFLFFTGANHIIIQNLAINNLYVHLCSLPLSSCTDNGTSTPTQYAVWFESSSNITVQNNVIHDAFGGVVMQPVSTGTFSGNVITGNEIYNCNWDVSPENGEANATLSVNIYNNKFHDWLNWGTASGTYFHHNGVFVFTVGSGPNAIINGSIYNNLFYGQLDAASGMVYIEDDSNTGRPIQLNVYNNVVYITASVVSGVVACLYDWGTGTVYVNNTCLLSSNSGGNAENLILEYNASTTGNTYENNIANTCSYGVNANESGANIAASDYNDVYNCANYGAYRGTIESSLSGWHTLTGYDTHSITTNPNMNASSSPPYQLTNTSSPAYRTGVNLTSLCGTLTALCTDPAGNARPSSGAWDMGAYYLSSGSSTVATPTFSPVAGTYTSTQSVAITSSTSGVTICATTDGTTPTATTPGTCTHGTSLSNGGFVTVSASETVNAIGTFSGDTNSSVASAAYTISGTMPQPVPPTGLVGLIQ